MNTSSLLDCYALTIQLERLHTRPLMRPTDEHRDSEGGSVESYGTWCAYRGGKRGVMVRMGWGNTNSSSPSCFPDDQCAIWLKGPDQVA